MGDRHAFEAIAMTLPRCLYGTSSCNGFGQGAQSDKLRLEVVHSRLQVTTFQTNVTYSGMLDCDLGHSAWFGYGVYLIGLIPIIFKRIEGG